MNTRKLSRKMRGGTKFKIYDKKEKRFFNQSKLPESIWKDRFQLGIWNNSSSKIDDLNKRMKKFGNLELHVKVKNRFVKYSPELLKAIVSDDKKKGIELKRKIDNCEGPWALMCAHRNKKLKEKTKKNKRAK